MKEKNEHERKTGYEKMKDKMKKEKRTEYNQWKNEREKRKEEKKMKVKEPNMVNEK